MKNGSSLSPSGGFWMSVSCRVVMGLQRILYYSKFVWICLSGRFRSLHQRVLWSWLEWRFCTFYRVFHAAVQLGVVNDLVYEGDLFWAFCFPVRLLGFVPVPDSRAVIMECVFEDLRVQFSISAGIRTFPGEWEYTFSYVFCSDLLQNWYVLCGAWVSVLWAAGVVWAGVFGSCVFVSGEDGVPEGCVLGGWGAVSDGGGRVRGVQFFVCVLQWCAAKLVWIMCGMCN